MTPQGYPVSDQIAGIVSFYRAVGILSIQLETGSHYVTDIGQKLIDKAIKLLKERKMRKLIARTKSDNKEAVQLFKHNSFEQEGYFKEHYRKTIDVVQLYRFL